MSASEEKKTTKVQKHVYLIRHGQSTSNVSGKNSPLATLTKEGVLQCIQLHSRLRTLFRTESTTLIDHILVSPLTRATQTYNIVFSGIPHKKLTIMDELREWEAYEDGFEKEYKPLMPQDKVEANTQQTEEMAMANSSFVPPYPSTWLQRETLDEFLRNRMKRVLEFIRSSPDTTFYVVGHGVWIRLFTQCALKVPEIDHVSYLPNCGVFPLKLSFDNQSTSPPLFSTPSSSSSPIVDEKCVKTTNPDPNREESKTVTDVVSEPKETKTQEEQNCSTFLNSSVSHLYFADCD